MEMVIGKSFEELNDQEMYAIQGGGVETVALTTWSSAPCCIGASVGAVVVVAGIAIYKYCSK